MKEYGGFEHNLQSLRIVDSLENDYVDFKGLNLTFETREGILKHCSNKNALKLGKLGSVLFKRSNHHLRHSWSTLLMKLLITIMILMMAIVQGW